MRVVVFEVSWQRADTVTERTQAEDWRDTMWNLGDRVIKAVSDMTVGTLIVLVHVAMADRRQLRAQRKRLAN
jgi:hypothetical protein